MFFIIPIFFATSKSEIDKKKLLSLMLSIAIILFVFVTFFVLMLFNIFITDYISTELFFVLSGIFGGIVPFIVKLFLK